MPAVCCPDELPWPIACCLSRLIKGGLATAAAVPLPPHPGAGAACLNIFLYPLATVRLSKAAFVAGVSYTALAPFCLLGWLPVFLACILVPLAAAGAAATHDEFFGELAEAALPPAMYQHLRDNHGVLSGESGLAAVCGWKGAACLQALAPQPLPPPSCHRHLRSCPDTLQKRCCPTTGTGKPSSNARSLQVRYQCEGVVTWLRAWAAARRTPHTVDSGLPHCILAQVLCSLCTPTHAVAIVSLFLFGCRTPLIEALQARLAGSAEPATPGPTPGPAPSP